MIWWKDVVEITLVEYCGKSAKEAATERSVSSELRDTVIGVLSNA